MRGILRRIDPGRRNEFPKNRSRHAKLALNHLTTQQWLTILLSIQWLNGQQFSGETHGANDQIISTRLRPLGTESLQQLYETLQVFNTLLGAQFTSGELPALIEHAITQNQILT